MLVARGRRWYQAVLAEMRNEPRRALSLASGRVLRLGLALAALTSSSTTRAQQAEQAHVERSPAPKQTTLVREDRAVVTAQSETYLQLFRRALLPGSHGSIVTADWGSPITQYLFVRARDVDAPWRQDSIEIEVGVWGQVWPTEARFERPFDGDIQSANLAYRAGPLLVRLGRQLVAGGAARFARFDGLAASAALPAGLSLTGYGGWAVLPRWDGLAGYHRLGIAERELLMAPLPSLSRAEHWLSGARLGLHQEWLSGALSFHEQREAGGLERRNLGVDAAANLGERAQAGGSALLELDQRRLAEARAWLELRPWHGLAATLEGLRTKPALLLSRQSVLSVFATGAYDELGGTASWRALSWLRFEGHSYVELYEVGRPGARFEGGSRLDLEDPKHTSVRLAYGRVLVADRGYHAVRLALSRHLTPRLAGTLQAYGYLYDVPVLGFSSSAAYSSTLDYALSEAVDLLWGASVFRSPYARLDAQAVLRLTVQLDSTGRRAQ